MKEDLILIALILGICVTLTVGCNSFQAMRFEVKKACIESPTCDISKYDDL